MSPAGTRYLAFLRAINVGGHTVTSPALKQLFEALGVRDVETFLASGNVWFTAPGPARAALERRIARHLERSLGYEVATFLRTPAELRRVVAHRAFTGVPAGSTLYVGFHATPLTPAHARAVAALDHRVDTFHPHGTELYRWCTLSIGQSPLTGTALERAAGQPVTFRRSTTVAKLAAR